MSAVPGGRGTHAERIGRMCWEEAPFSESRSRSSPDEAPIGRLRHWGRAALELRQARRGSARIPLRGNPGNASIGKAPGKTSRELGSAVIRASLDVPRRASEKVAGAGASGKAREEEKSSAPPQPSFSLWQIVQRRISTAEDRMRAFIGGLVIAEWQPEQALLMRWCIHSTTAGSASRKIWMGKRIS
ncbi:hypothetical protein NDU88_004467 [Pleurodeles waltl]|uniref:Uncharacterized protein n=1 Tax=Pleurodeles waltl TaxID=8319 RepID=A0AAV7MTJ1_PLEWA|nr:hypothetical protein NDU88_004467 [Pleurodeles waltl]